MTEENQFDKIRNLEIKNIRNISKFIENNVNNIFGFTLTMKNAVIKNYFINGDYINNRAKILKLKEKYKSIYRHFKKYDN